MKLKTLSLLLLVFPAVIYAQSVTIKMYTTVQQGLGKEIGTIKAKDTAKGLLLMPHLRNLTPGPHGIHIHQKPSCENNGEAAGPHLDPTTSGKHEGPYGQGHLGDLPFLAVDSNGKASKPLLAPRLKLSDIRNHALIIHEGGDNYSDSPKKLGGGGARIACGIIPQ